MKQSLLAIALGAALSLPQIAPVLAADATAVPPTDANTQAQASRGYLGVIVDHLPQPVRAQLPADLPPGEGLLVDQVVQDSPAAKAGLQPFDILLQYNDQKLFSPEQLIQLVGSERSGQPAQLTVVRGGKVSTRAVTLGEVNQPQVAHRESRQESDKVWQSFDLLSLNKIGNDKYKAEIGYLADDGTHKRLAFEGTRDEIRQKILAQKDLPAMERDQLLNALSARNNVFPFDTWAFGPMQNEMFGAPVWGGWYPYF
jgi:membrane-associated protease RseP (regulator of RpoE activity)